MLINIFFSFSFFLLQLSTSDNIEFTIFNKTVLIQDSVEHLVKERIDDDGMIETTVFSDDIRKEMGTISFSDAFREARKLKGAGKTFEWNGNIYSTNYANEVFEVLDTEVAVEEILIDETEPQLSQVENDESLAYNIQ